MNSDIFPCLWFNQDGVEAANFYTNLFKGTILVDTPFVLNIELLGQKFMILNGGPQFQKNASVSLTVFLNSQEEASCLWEGLSTSGMPIDHLTSESHDFGWVTDKYGVTWHFVYDPSHLVEQKIVPTLLFSHDSEKDFPRKDYYYTSIFSKIYSNSENETLGVSSLLKGDFRWAKLEHYDLLIYTTGQANDLAFSEGISLVVMTDTQEETDALWYSLCENGGVESRCGWLKDACGVSWQIVPKTLIELMNDVENPEKAQKVMMALSSMNKIIIADLEKAYNS